MTASRAQDWEASSRVDRLNGQDLVKLAAWFNGMMTPYSNSLTTARRNHYFRF